MTRGVAAHIKDTEESIHTIHLLFGLHVAVRYYLRISFGSVSLQMYICV